MRARAFFWLCYLASVLYLGACVVDAALSLVEVEVVCATDSDCQARGGDGGPE